jgi:hypothetical protein
MTDTRDDEFDIIANQQAIVAQRLLLAELLEDDDARDVVVDEMDDCAGCWRAIATRLAFEAAAHFRVAAGSADRAVAATEHQIANLLEATECLEQDDD